MEMQTASGNSDFGNNTIESVESKLYFKIGNSTYHPYHPKHPLIQSQLQEHTPELNQQFTSNAKQYSVYV